LGQKCFIGMDLEEFLPDAKHRRLVEWLTTPPKERVPNSQRKLAEELGVAPRTIRSWQARDDVRRAWSKMSEHIVGDPSKVQEVLETLRQTAIDPSHRQFTQSAKLYLEAVDAIKPPDRSVEVNLSSEAISALSDDKLEAVIAEQVAMQRAQESLGHRPESVGGG
jgi:hypothetical protein